MIRYTLKCSQDHVFESWFANAEGFEKLKASGHVACAICGDTSVEKTLMAPAVAPNAKAPEKVAEAPPLQQPTSPQEVMMQKFKEHVEANSDYVGKDFATTARAIHDGAEPDRAIHGEASLGEAKSLLDDGIPVAPLPFTTNRRTN
ncbi:MAG: DUF1178 family protein [Pseudomonadota bacterium]